MNRRAWMIAAVLLLAIFALAAGLRLHAIGVQSLWYDEAFSVYLARMDLSEITARTAADIQPPLYYYLLHAWIRLFGDGESALRGLSALFGILTVPLLAVVGWQLFRSRTAALLAALLAAVSPLHVWYAQETRMYTLLVFLCLLSSSLLLEIVSRSRAARIPALPPASLPPAATRWPFRPASDGVTVWLLWAGFAAASVTALYTHYFALFVLAFQAAYVLLVWAAQELRPVRLAIGGAIAGAGIALAYLPWLPAQLERYAADVSYWPGQLKLGEVLVDIVLSFVGGETLPERLGLALAAGCGAVLLLALIGFAAGNTPKAAGKPQGASLMPQAASGNTQLPLLFLLLYLLLPPALILLLSYNTPKFNARYVMISHPALLLLFAGGLGVLLAPVQRAGGRAAARLGPAVGALLAGVALVFLLGVSQLADRNAYGAPDFARPDFKNAVHYLQEHLEPGETTILTSGHAFPVFDYYAPNTERHLLPDSPTLDTTNTLDYGISADLNRWLADPARPRTGVWLLLWQDEVVDPVGYLTAMLDQVGDPQPVTASFPKVRLLHYHLPVGSRFVEDGRPAIDHPADFNFDNKLRLLGYDQSGENQVTLYWQALQPLDEDYKASVVLADTEGQEWGRWDGRLAAYAYPTSRWRVGQVVFSRIDLPRVPGRPPGDYGLQVGVYTDADLAGLDVLDLAGAAQSKRAVLGAVTLVGYIVPADQVVMAHPTQVDMGDGLTLLGWDSSQAEAQAGDRVLLGLAWGTSVTPEGVYGVQVLVTDATGTTYNGGTFPPTNLWHPTNIWQPGQAWRGQLTFRLPIQAQPGEGRLAVRLIDPQGKAVGPIAYLGPLRVLPTSRIFVAPTPGVLRQSNLNDQVLLLGADLPGEPATPGETLRLTLYWKSLAATDVPYTVFVHLVTPQGKVAAQEDIGPVGGTRPTTGWVPGEFVADPHVIALPTDLAPGAYVIEVGMYDAGARGMPRLPVLGGEGQGTTDRVIFGPVQVK